MTIATSRNEQINRILCAARKDMSALDAQRNAERQVWLDNASAEERRELAIVDRLRADSRYQSISDRLTRIQKKFRGTRYGVISPSQLWV